jgi:hypothetical protein
MTLRRFLDASAGHLTPETCAWLDRAFDDDALRDPRNHAAGQLAGGRTRYGWFVYAPEDPRAVALPEDLASVLRHARRLGAEYVLFDCDATPLLELPTLHPDYHAPGTP